MPKNPDLILASGSTARQSMLKSVGLSYDIHPADLDEETLIHEAWKKKETIEEITEMLATAKAKAVSEKHTDSFVIGSDQTLEFDGNILSKAKSKGEAADKIRLLSGKTHHLISSVSVVKNAQTLFSCTESASLTMKQLTEEELTTYINADPDALTACVGAYKIEGAGAALFTEVNGSQYTIMGMPLPPLLGFLKTQGFRI